MFMIIRNIICVAFAGCAIVAIKKSKLANKVFLIVVSVCLAVTMIVALAFVPVENLFITFSSPEAAFKYYNMNISSVALVVEGYTSDFVVAYNGNTKSYLAIPKTSDGWKIGISTNTKCIVQNYTNGINIEVFQYKDTNDYYVTILDTYGGASTITDAYNTDFQSIENNISALEKTYITYYAHIPDYSSGYSITVNGNEIILPVR